MSFPEEAAHPRYYGEGYPDWPGRASNKEGESWTSIAGLSSESIRQSCAMRLRSRRMVVDVRYLGEIDTTEAATRKLVTKLAAKYRQLTFCCQSASNFDPRSASNFDPLERRVRAVALAPSELVGVAETARARVGE